MITNVVALVARRQRPQFVGVENMTPGQRAWLAWQLLPTDARGQLPSWRSIERAVGLSNAALPRFIWDERTRRPGPDTLEKLARALGVSATWLWTGRGAGPVIDRKVTPRPSEKPPRGTVFRPPPAFSEPGAAPVREPSEKKIAL